MPTSPAPSKSSPAAARAKGARSPAALRTTVVCATLLVTFAALALFSSRSKSPTYDEPLHVLAAHMQTHFGDFRVDPEDPPLWKYLPGLAGGRDAIKVPFDSAVYPTILDDLYHEWQFTVEALYRTDENASRSDDLVQRMRATMILVGAALGLIIAWWGWQLGGPVAAVVATALFAFCPNFLAHAPLVKNDVPLSLCATALILAVWRAGRRLSVANALAIAVLCAAVVTVKFTGLLFGPIVAILLLIRAFGPQPWETFWRTLTSRMDKFIAASLLIVACALVSYFGIWASYGFRFTPSPPAPGAVYAKFDMKPMVVYASMTEFMVRNGRLPTTEETDNIKMSRMTRTVMTMEDMHFLPQAWLYGLLYTYQSALVRKTFLLGKFSNMGWWYYFPVAIAVKTPLATIAAMGLALALAIRTAVSRGWKTAAKSTASSWTAACMVLPPAIFLLWAMRSNLNLGLRHILPIYPFIFLGIGVAAARAWEQRQRATKIVATILAVGLFVETLANFPNYLPFFNIAVGGSRGGIKILGDSNLDWGQDLKLLAQWQQKHRDVNLYLVYFGIADPWAYGIDYVNFPGGYGFGEKYQIRGDPGFLAISATMLQGIYNDPALRESYGRLHDVEPVEVLGGSIYIYRWPPPKLK